MQDLTLVIGGTGKTGRRVAERLKAQGRPVRVGSRSGATPFDWEDRATWEPALRGATAAGYLLDPVRSGEVALPVGDVPEPFVDAEDIADVAVAALTEDGHAGEIYELTGPLSLTFAQATEEIARACGRPVSFVAVPIDAHTAAAAAHGVPADVVALLGYLFTEVLDGRNIDPADGVQRALGRQ